MKHVNLKSCAAGHHCRRGFTLLEVMAAVLIIGFALVALIQVQGGVMRRTLSVQDRARALMAAETALDSFLAQPDFGDLSRPTPIDALVEVTLEEYDDFIITLALKDRFPLDNQETVEAFPELADEILTRRQEEIGQAVGTQSGNSDEGGSGGSGVRGQAAASSGDEAFDPGAFIAVRVEVRKRSTDRLLSTLEMWLPRPLRPEEEEEL